MVFFVLSGYLVGGSVLRSLVADRWSWKHYLFNRLTRIYIVLIPSLLLGLCWDQIGIRLPGAAFFYGGHDTALFLTNSVYVRMTAKAFVGNILFLQVVSSRHLGIHPFNSFGSNTPLWSLCNEFWYYVMFPVLALTIKPVQTMVNRLLHVVLLLAILCIVGSDLALYMIPWLMGVLVNFAPRSSLGKHSTVRAIRGIALSIFILGMVSPRFILMHSARISIWNDMAVGLESTLLIWALVQAQPASSPPITQGFVSSQIAKSSYTLYLVHLPLLVFLKVVFHVVPGQPSPLALLIFLTVCLSVFGYSQIVYISFERHTDSIRQKLRLILFTARERSTIFRVLQAIPGHGFRPR